MLFQHLVCGFEIVSRFDDTVIVRHVGGPQLVANDLLQRRRDVEVEEPVPEPHFARRIGILGNEPDRARTELVEIFDDDGRLGHDHIARDVLDDGKLAHRPVGDQFGARFLARQIDMPGIEFDAVLVERDQHLVAVGRQRMVIEDQ